jgi:hypothetical protein
MRVISIARVQIPVECGKPFLDIAYGFPVIVLDKGASFKKTTLVTVLGMITGKGA